MLLGPFGPPFFPASLHFRRDSEVGMCGTRNFFN